MTALVESPVVVPEPAAPPPPAAKLSLLERIKAHLVADWRDVGRWWSARMNAIGVIVYPLLISVQAMPPEAQAFFPLKYRAVVAGIYSLAALLARIYAQPKPPTSA